MHNFKIGFDFVIIFKTQTYLLAVFNDETSKVILFLKNVSIFTFKDTGLDTQRYDKKTLIIQPDLNSGYPHTPC